MEVVCGFLLGVALGLLLYWAARKSVEPEARFVEGQFCRVGLGPEDVIVLSYPGMLSEATDFHLQDTLERRFPGHAVLILDQGMKSGAMGPGKGDGHDSSEDR